MKRILVFTIVFCLLAVVTVAATDFSWVFPPYPLAYLQYRTVDIFGNPDGINNLTCTVWFFDEDPDYVVRAPRIDTVSPNTPYTSASYIGITQVSGERGIGVKFAYTLKWAGTELTKGWEKTPPDEWETVTVERGEPRQYQLNFTANTNDPHILVVKNLLWDPIKILDFTICGKSTLVLVFVPNNYSNSLVFNGESEYSDVSFEYIIKRIPESNP